jgi:HPt (histidine-containing phosphotransfer) domain-containing protein
MIDWTKLHDLRASIGENDFSQLAHLFVTEMGERLALLASAPNTATVEDFHFLRGGAANLGLLTMVAACHAAEAACRAGAVPDIRAVSHAFGAAVTAIQAELPQIASAA